MKRFKIGVLVYVACALAACGGENNDGNNGQTNGTPNAETNSATNNPMANNSAPECPADNPLVGSCGDLNFLGGCFEPDMSGTCSMTVSTEWSDGSKVERSTDGTGGFYGPGDTEPCATFSYDLATATTTFEKDGETWTQVDNGDGTFTMTCPDGTSFDYTAADTGPYNECRGITCSDSGGGNNATNAAAGTCTGADGCPGSVCCQTAVSTSCVPDEATCGQVMGTVLP